MSLQRSAMSLQRASRAFQAIQASPRLSPLAQRPHQQQRGSAPLHPRRGAHVAPASAAAVAADGPSTSGSSSSGGGSPAAPQAFVGLERLISESLGGGGVPGGDWREVEGSWVLYPPQDFGQPRCLVHFVGGAFVGAAPQLAYK